MKMIGKPFENPELMCQFIGALNRLPKGTQVMYVDATGERKLGSFHTVDDVNVGTAVVFGLSAEGGIVPLRVAYENIYLMLDDGKPVEEPKASENTDA